MRLVAAISSAKGGSGKTTTALNLGVALQQLGRDVTVVDGNLHAPSVAVALGAAGVPVALHHVLKGEAALHQAVYAHRSGMKIVPGSLQHHDLQDHHFSALGTYLQNMPGNIVLVDSAPGLGRDVREVLKSVHDVLLVTTPDLMSVTQTLKTAKAAQRQGKPIAGVVVTRYGGEHEVALADI